MGRNSGLAIWREQEAWIAALGHCVNGRDGSVRVMSLKRFCQNIVEELRREAGLADKAGRAEDRVELQARVEEVQALDRKLQQIQEGHHEGPEGGPLDFRILTPWKEPAAHG